MKSTLKHIPTSSNDMTLMGNTNDGKTAFVNSDGFIKIYSSKYNPQTKVHSDLKRIVTRFRTIGEYNKSLAEKAKRKHADSIRAKELKIQSELQQLVIE